MGIFLQVSLCLVACLAVAWAQEPTIINEFETSVQDVENETSKEIDDKMKTFFHDSRNKLYLAFYNLSSYLPLSIPYAETVGPECDIIQYNKEYFTTAGLVLAGILALLGVLFAFFGYRFIKIVLFLIGFVIGSSLTYFTILALVSDNLHETWVPYTAAAVSLVVGIICGVLTICIYYIGIFLAGASIGFLMTWFVLAAINIQFFQEHIYVPVIGAVVGAVIIGVLSLWIQKWFFMIGTAILGSFMLCWGLDYYLELGSMVYYLLLFAEHRSRLDPCWYSWAMIPVFVVTAVGAFIVQALLTGRKYDHRKELRGWCCCGMCQKTKKKKRRSNGGRYLELTSRDED